MLRVELSQKSRLISAMLSSSLSGGGPYSRCFVPSRKIPNVHKTNVVHCPKSRQAIHKYPSYTMTTCSTEIDGCPIQYTRVPTFPTIVAVHTCAMQSCFTKTLPARFPNCCTQLPATPRRAAKSSTAMKIKQGARCRSRRAPASLSTDQQTSIHRPA